MVCLDVLNFVTVTLYGCIIMILFMNETENKLHICGLFAICLLGGILNLVLRQKFSNGILYMTYPLTVHLPLLLYFIFVMKNSVYGAIFALTAAYMLTTPRKWLCILVTHLLGGGALAEAAAEIGVSVVLLLLIAKFMSKIVRKIFAGGPKEAKYLCILPAAVYVITYATTVYSDFLMSRPNITIPVLTTALSVFFIGFEIYFFDYVFERVNVRHSKQLADLQLRSVERLAECIGGGETYFCENKTVNGFLSMYKSAAAAKNIFFVCNCNLPENINTFDVLVIIASVLDDALNTAKQYIRFEAVRNKNQISIKAETDGKGIYDNAMLATLDSSVKKNNGMIYTDKENYKIQISIKKGEDLK